MTSEGSGEQKCGGLMGEGGVSMQCLASILWIPIGIGC
jgi:hypothetical protein